MRYLYIILLFLASASFAQVPVPAQDQNSPVMLTGGTAHLGTGEVVQNAVVAFNQGKIVYAGQANGSPSQDGYQVIDVSGKHIYPGFILPNIQLGLQEVSNIRQMNDYNEEGTLNPNVRAVIAYNTDSEYTPTFRYNGILLAETTPTGGIISGTSSVMELEGWNWEDAVHSLDMAIHMNWPSRTLRRFDFATFSVRTEDNKNYDKQVDMIKGQMQDAISYGKLAAKTSNLKLDAMQGLFDGSKVLMLHSDRPKEIIEGVKLAKEMGVQKVTVITGDAAWYIKDFIKENNIPVVLSQTHRAPSRPDDDYDWPYKLPAKLQAEGIPVALSHSNGGMGRARNLPFYAGTTVAHGMDKEDALKSITINAAKALGIDARVGTLETGKDATLFVSEGDALDMRTNVLTHAYISGKQVTLDNKQQALYERYSAKYGHEK